jgi:hypothetical protein
MMYRTPPRSGRISGFAPGDRSNACLSSRIALSWTRNSDADPAKLRLKPTSGRIFAESPHYSPATRVFGRGQSSTATNIPAAAGTIPHRNVKFHRVVCERRRFTSGMTLAHFRASDIARDFCTVTASVKHGIPVRVSLKSQAAKEVA